MPSNSRAPRKRATSKPPRAPEAPPEVPDTAPRSAPNRRLRPSAPEIPDEPEVEARPPLSRRLREKRARFVARVRGPLVLVGKLILAAAVVVGGVAAWRLGDRYLHTSPAFAITTLQVEGAEHVTDAQAFEAAGLVLGQNVFEVTPEDARARLLRHPWIATASVERRLPGTLRVTVTEHEPAAVLSIGALYLVGDDGSVFKQVDADDSLDLPVVTGVDEGRFLRDRVFRTALLQDVITLMHDYRSAGLWRREPIGEIHLESDDGLSLYVGADAMLVRLGRGPWREKLSKLRRVLDRLDEQETRATYVFLDNQRRPDRVTVRLREEPDVVPAAVEDQVES